MIDFTTLKALTIPEGVVTKITNVNGDVLWKQAINDPRIILQVEKITSDTYANNTTYTNESFILLDIFSKANGTITVTYGNLTKTITNTTSSDAAHQVFFGTFKGVSDSMETPTSGTLTVEGDYCSIGVASYNTAKSTTKRYYGIKNIDSLGTIEYIAPYAFYDCTSITSINIPNGVTTISSNAFYNCKNLKYITIPDSVTYIASYAFYGCSLLRSINIPNSVTTISSYAFYSCTSLTSITIPDSVTSIGDNAFYNCISLTSITIPNSVTSIYSYAFYECSKLTSITIPNGVTSIEDFTFGGCRSLTSITIPDSVTSINSHAFQGCSSLTSIIFMGTQDQWAAISFGENWDADLNENKTIHYMG